MHTETYSDTHPSGTIIEHARALLTATADVAEEKVSDARKRLAAALDSGEAMCGRAREKAIDGVKAAGEAVEHHPYQAIGVAFGLGAILGYLTSRQGSRNGN